MINVLKQFINSHYLFALYLIVASGILIGLIEGFDPKYSIWVAFLYIIPLIAFYAILQFVFKKASLGEKYNKGIKLIAFNNRFSNNQIVWTLLSIILLVLLVHVIYLKGFPGFEALMEFKLRKLVYIRRGVTTKLPEWFKYVYSFTLKGIIPMTLLLAYYWKNKKAFIAMTIIAFVFGVNGMQKGHFLTFYGPTLILMLVDKNFKRAAILSAYIFFCLLLLVFISNPGLKYTVMKHFIDIKMTKDVSQEVILDDSGAGGEGIVKANKKAVNSLILRTFYLPGATVGRWFDAVPQKKPFLHGKGYKWYAKITGKKFHDYGAELYPVLYPNYVKRGFIGRVNVASFMYDFVNFGKWGLVLSAFLMACVISFVNLLFYKDLKMLVVINSMPVLYLSSTNYTTLLFSGGWFLLICLYLLFLRNSKSVA